MAVQGIDNATRIWDLTEAKNQGFSFVMRYGPPSAYAASFSECDSIRQQGLGFGHVFEVQADRALRGASQGTRDGHQHDAWADECGAPSWVRLAYCAQDMSMTLDQLRGPVADYARAFDAACKRPTMPYGSYDAIEVLCGELHIAACGWQTAGWSGNGQGSGGSFHCSDGTVRRLSRFTGMFQDVGSVLGGKADRNVVCNDFPVDWAWGGPYTGPTTPPTQEDDMINWRPTKCPQTGNQEWLLQPADGGGFYRYKLRENEATDLWGQGYIQTVGAIELDAEAGQRFLDRYPEAKKLDVDALAEEIAEKLIDAGIVVHVDKTAIANEVCDVMAHRLTPTRT